MLAGPVRRSEKRNVRLVQGSHVVVRRRYDDPRAFIFQNSDGRIVFAIPYERDFTLIGTTDRDYRGDPGAAAISDGEADYLCRAASEYFAEPVGRDDIVWTYSAVRPLFDDGASAAQEATRDYVLKAEGGEGAPMINVFGGKITTYRRLAESMLERIGDRIGRKGAPWTAGATLPGGDFPVTGFDELAEKLRRDYPFLSGSAGRAARPALRNRGLGVSRPGEGAGRPRPRFRRRADGSRGRPPHGPGVGGDGRRRVVAANQARAEDRQRGSGRTRRIHAGAPAGPKRGRSMKRTASGVDARAV